MNKIVIIFNNFYFILVKIYTYVYYYANKIYKNLYKTYKKNNNYIIYVKDGMEYTENNIIFEYDFIIYVAFINDIKTYNIIYKNHFDRVSKNIIEKTLNPIMVDYKFTLVKLYTNDNTYDITNILKDKNNYLYMENNNLFDKNFLKWFYKNYLKISYDENNYIVAFDNIFNKNVVSKDKYIILHKNSYELR